MLPFLYKKNYLVKSYSLRSEIDKLLIFSSLFSIVLAFVRVAYTGQLLFLSLIWNLFLAFVPFALTTFLIQRPHLIKDKWKLSLVSIAWLLFIPNSFYIITDLFHLQKRFLIPLWFDLALIFSFVWNGLLFGILSVRQMEKIWSLKWRWSEFLFIYPVMLLNAIGIYIGRYLRYNTWDIISDPFDLSEDILYLIIHPIRNRFDWSMIFCFSVFMTILYLSFKKMGREAWQ